MDDYEAYRQNKMESGLCYQDFIADLFLRVLVIPIASYSSRLYQMREGESRQGVEIKHDERYAATGNLYIEVAEKARPRPGDYAPSGIFREDNTWLYAIGNYDEVFVFPKHVLVALYESKRFRRVENQTQTSKGFLIPAAPARQFASLVLAPKLEQKIVKAPLGDLQRRGQDLYRLLTTDPAQQNFLDLEGDLR